MARVVESMTRVELPDGRVVRVWRDETEGCPKGSAGYDWVSIRERNHRELAEFIQGWCFLSGSLAEAVSRIDRVNAVEVLEKDGSGILIYPEWP